MMRICTIEILSIENQSMLMFGNGQQNPTRYIYDHQKAWHWARLNF